MVCVGPIRWLHITAGWKAYSYRQDPALADLGFPICQILVICWFLFVNSYRNLAMFLTTSLTVFCVCLATAMAKPQAVTCGSAIKLMNSAHKIRLHSHDVKYGSGSGQQSVTGTTGKEDVNSHWTIKGPEDKSYCKRGEPIECGQKIRLEHLTTHLNLHSHHFSSPLTNAQEVSAFGDGGSGDSGDVWTVMCEGDYWVRDDNMQLKHVDTGAFLAASGQTFGRPINGQV